jgi:hypothetical protein
MENKYICKHCGAELSKVLMPLGSDWGVEYFMICMNDECGYYVRGWKWMLEQFKVHSSYRYKYDTFTGQDGPIPVFTPDDLKSLVAEKEL